MPVDFKKTHKDARTQARIGAVRSRLAVPTNEKGLWGGLLVGLLLTGYVAFSSLPSAYLEAFPGAAITSGQVVGTDVTRGPRGSHNYSVDYRFMAQGIQIQGSTGVRRDVWSSLHAGDPTWVCYLPSDPRVSDLEGNHLNFLEALAASSWFVFFAWLTIRKARSRLLGEDRSTTPSYAIPRRLWALMALVLFGSTLVWIFYQVT